MEPITTAIIAALLASTRFTWGPLMTASSGFSYWETFFTALIGGTLGTFFYYYSAHYLYLWLKKRAERKGNKKVFTKTNRKIIRVKHKFGIWGIALLTPPVFSIMIGTMVAYRFYKTQKSTIPILLVSVVIYDFIYTSLYHGLIDIVLAWWESL